jgi:hypothetical protein
MATLIENPTIVQAAGNKPKRIEEFVGRVNTGRAEYVAVYLPAFSPDTVHRDSE